MKQGAMFGLDARIALAIFGALSVISGAALYSAIQDSKVNTVVTEMTEVIKAWEEYMINTGKDLEVDTTNTQRRHRNMSHLVTDTGIKGWAGPYLSYEIHDSKPRRLKHNILKGPIGLISVSKKNWGAGHSNTAWSWPGVVCNNSTIPCYTATMFIDNTSDKRFYKMASLIDEKIDSGNGSYTGKFRWYSSSGNTLILIGPAYKSPPTY